MDQKVYQIYDKITDWFDAHRRKDLLFEKFYLNLICNQIPSGVNVLDVGVLCR